MEKTSMLETEILGEKVILRTKCGEMTFPHYVFESMARKFWKNQTNCKMVYGGYRTKKTIFEYTKDGDVSFVQVDHYITISHEDAVNLFDFYHKNHTFSIEWKKIVGGAMLNNSFFIPSQHIEYIEEVRELYSDSDNNCENLRGHLRGSDDVSYSFYIDDGMISITCEDNRAVFDRPEWLDFVWEMRE